LRCRKKVISLVTFTTIACFTNVAFNSASPTASSPAISSNSTVSPMLSPRPHSGAHRYHNYNVCTDLPHVTHTHAESQSCRTALCAATT
jgi:hypothetical protein